MLHKSGKDESEILIVWGNESVHFVRLQQGNQAAAGMGVVSWYPLGSMRMYPLTDVTDALGTSDVPGSLITHCKAFLSPAMHEEWQFVSSDDSH